MVNELSPWSGSVNACLFLSLSPSLSLSLSLSVCVCVSVLVCMSLALSPCLSSVFVSLFRGGYNGVDRPMTRSINLRQVFFAGH
jgi:hypothetical protein